MELRPPCLMILLTGLISVTRAERPKPVVDIQPYKPVLLGDSVTLTCYIWTGGPWEYHWYRNNEELRSAAGKNTYTITDVKGSDKSAFRCKGTQSSDPKYTQISDEFILTISEKPKPELTSNPQGDLFTGNPVTLYCRLNVHYSGWRYYWIKDTQSLETETETHSYTISSVQISDGGQYRCRAGKDNPVYYTHYSDALWLNVTESPKPVVVIKPDTRVFRGEKVIFLCEMPTGRSTHWSYTWYSNKFYEPFSPASLFRIQLITDYNSGTYWCRGDIGYDQKSKMSDPVGLWVSAKPKPDLTSDLKGPALSGNSVTLYCTLNAQSAGWRFYWRKDEQINETETETHSYTIRPVNVSDGGQYRCRAGRGNPVYYTHYSDTLWVNITGESPPVSLIINPSRSQHFTADSLSLSCEDQRNSTGWTVRGYTHNELFNCSSDSGFSCNISALSISHTGVYWCQSESGERSISVNITVHHGDVILDSPIHSVTDGKPLTLCCLYRNTKILVSGVYFYKNDFIFKNQARRQMTISSISNSEEGFYHCKHPERGESPNSWISVKVSNSISTGAIIGLSLAFMFVIIMILLILLLCYRKKKGVFAAGISYKTYSRTMIRN